MPLDQLLLQNPHHRLLQLLADHTGAPFLLLPQTCRNPLEVRGRIEGGDEGGAFGPVEGAGRGEKGVDEQGRVGRGGEGSVEGEEGPEELAGDNVAVAVRGGCMISTRQWGKAKKRRTALAERG